MKKEGSSINRICKFLRKSSVLSLLVVSLLLMWNAYFDVVKEFFLRNLSENTISVLRMLLQYCFGTSSVTVTIQLLLSYSFIFIGISSCTMFVLRLVKFLLFASKYGELSTPVNHVSNGQVYRESRNDRFLSFSRLNL